MNKDNEKRSQETAAVKTKGSGKKFVLGLLVGGAAMFVFCITNLNRPTVASNLPEETVVTVETESATDTGRDNGGSTIAEGVSLVGIDFASGEYYEGDDVTAEGLTVTARFSDGTSAEVADSDYVLYSVVAEHEGTVAMVETPYGAFEWNVPVIPVARMLASYEGVAYEGKEIGVSELVFTVEYENGQRKAARYSLTDLPSGTVTLGVGDTITVGYNGLDYEVELP